MEHISRLSDFQPHTRIRSSEVDAELDALVVKINLIADALTAVENASLSHLIKKLHRPSFKSSGGHSVVVPASTTKPARVWLNDSLCTNLTDATCDLSSSGRNGLDTGSIAYGTVYYLYAIPPVSGMTFDLVASVSGPSVGPTGFSQWFYLGSFGTYDTSISSGPIVPFVFSNGQLFSEDRFIWLGSTGSTSYVEKTLLTVPETARAVKLFVEMNPSGLHKAYVSGLGTSEGIEAFRLCAQSSSTHIFGYGVVPILVPGKIYYKVSDAGSTVNVAVYGWIEDPTEWL